MDAQTIIGTPGSGRRELALVGGGILALAVLFMLWRSRHEASSSVAADTGAAGYTYPMPAGGINTAPQDSSALTSLFTQNEEILRLLGPTSGPPSVGSTTGSPDPSKAGPEPTIGPVPRFGDDPERPGLSAYLNADGYRDLNNPANYLSGTYTRVAPVAPAPYDGPDYAYIDAQNRKVDEAGVPV